MPDVRDRFLIALAKFLGESPTKPKPLADVQVCQDWLLDEILQSILIGEDQLDLDREKFNRLMLNCGRQMVTEHFYVYFLADVKAIHDFEASVERFRVKAMWLFGNFKFGYKQLATSDKRVLQRLIERTTPRPPSDFEQREPFADIEPIDQDDLHLLGYISGRELADLDMSRQAISMLLAEPADPKIVLGRIGEAEYSSLPDSSPS